MSQKILITGGLGFQGSFITENLLERGHDITVLNTFSAEAERNASFLAEKPRVVWGSVTDPEIVEKTVRAQDTVIHLAGRINVDESIRDPAAFLDANIWGTHNVLEAVRHHDARLIHASTCEVYGAPHERRLIHEGAEFRPHSPYAASKAAGDRLCFAYHRTYGTNITIVRPFNIYGERQKEDAGGAAIAIFTKRALAGEPIVIFGDGSQTRDYMHVSDAVQAYCDVVLPNESLRGEAINFGTGKETSIRDIAEYVAKKLNTKIEYRAPRQGEVKSFVAADIAKARSLGFRPVVDIWAGIDRYIEWRRQFPV